MLDEVQKFARQGKKALAKIRAKELVRLRRAVQVFYVLDGRLGSVTYAALQMQGSNALVQAFQGCSKAMTLMDAEFSTLEVTQLARQFGVQQMLFQTKMEAVDSAVDDMDDSLEGVDGVEDEESEEDMVNAVLDEANIALVDKLEVAGSIRNREALMLDHADGKRGHGPNGNTDALLVYDEVAKEMDLEARFRRLRDGTPPA